MKGLRKRQRLQVLGIAGAAMVAVLVTLWFLPDDSFQFFRSPTDLAQGTPPPETERFRLGGLVAEGSIRADEGQRFYFDITDGGATVPVHYVGTDLPPDLFDEGQGTVATGHYVDGTFLATELLARHDEEYMPREVIEALKDQGVYVAPESGAAADGAPALN